MRSFIVSLNSEFYKSKKTLAFWSAILLPATICFLMSWGIISKEAELANDQAQMLWFRYVSAIVGVMGVLLLPVLVIYNTYAITNMEYKGETWKSLFSLPLSKFSIYASKYFYIVFLTFLTMALFVILIIATGHGIQLIAPKLEFGNYDANQIIFKFFAKLFLSTIGMISVQFLMNLMWNDFLKPFGIGFILLIMGIITSQLHWKYVHFLPYAYPNLTLSSIMSTKGGIDKLVIFDQGIYNSLICGAIFFIVGYFLVAKKSIK